MYWMSLTASNFKIPSRWARISLIERKYLAQFVNQAVWADPFTENNMIQQRYFSSERKKIILKILFASISRPHGK